MTRTQLLASFRILPRQPSVKLTRTEEVLAMYFTWWFMQRVREEHPEGILWAMPRYAVEAFDYLAQSDEAFTVECRRQLLKETGWSRIPRLTAPNDTSGGRPDAILRVAKVLALALVNPFAEHRIEDYCRAEDFVIRQAFQRFVGFVFQQGLYALLHEYPHRSGQFGATALRSTQQDDRYILTFAERASDGTEYRVTFSGAVEDADAVRYRNDGVGAPFLNAVVMIREVASRWPGTADEQRLALQPDEDIRVEPCSG